AWALVSVAVALLVVLVAVFWHLRRRPPPVPPREWALGAFDRLERDGVSGAAFVERVAAILREVIDRRFGIPAPGRTTPELLVAAERADGPGEEADALRGILDRCDRAKFAGDVPDDDGCRDLLARCRQWVDDVSPASPGPG